MQLTLLGFGFILFLFGFWFMFFSNHSFGFAQIFLLFRLGTCLFGYSSFILYSKLSYTFPRFFTYLFYNGIWMYDYMVSSIHWIRTPFWTLAINFEMKVAQKTYVTFLLGIIIFGSFQVNIFSVFFFRRIHIFVLQI